jgi:hypothetical protein
VSQSPKTFTTAEVEEIAEAAARRALHNFFNSLDVQSDDTQAVKRLRDNLNYLNEQREGTLVLKATLKRSAVYILYSAAVGVVYFMWDVVKDVVVTALHK